MLSICRHTAGLIRFCIYMELALELLSFLIVFFRMQQCTRTDTERLRSCQHCVRYHHYIHEQPFHLRFSIEFQVRKDNSFAVILIRSLQIVEITAFKLDEYKEIFIQIELRYKTAVNRPLAYHGMLAKYAEELWNKVFAFPRVGGGYHYIVIKTRYY